MTPQLTLIPVDTNVLIRLLKLREHPSESFNDVLRRVLPVQRRSQRPAKPEVPHAATPVRLAKSSGTGVDYAVLGERDVAPNAQEAMVRILRLLARRQPDLLERLATVVPGRSRNHIARSPDQVYPERPDLANYVVQLVPGWFIGTNIADREKLRIIEKACEVARLVFGRDVEVALHTD